MDMAVIILAWIGFVAVAVLTVRGLAGLIAPR